MTAWELFILGVSSETGQIIGIILCRDSESDWVYRETVDVPLTECTRVSSYLAGDGSAMLAFMNHGTLHISGSLPWSWEEWDDHARVDGGWGARITDRDRPPVDRYARRYVPMHKHKYVYCS
jgi:hypothetical protein